MTRSSFDDRRYRTPCSQCNTFAHGVAFPAMISERWLRLTLALRATSFWLTPWASMRSLTEFWFTQARWAGATAAEASRAASRRA